MLDQIEMGQFVHPRVDDGDDDGDDDDDDDDGDEPPSLFLM